jgi:hypothetical protein
MKCGNILGAMNEKVWIPFYELGKNSLQLNNLTRRRKRLLDDMRYINSLCSRGVKENKTIATVNPSVSLGQNVLILKTLQDKENHRFQRSF